MKLTKAINLTHHPPVEIHNQRNEGHGIPTLHIQDFDYVHVQAAYPIAEIHFL